MTALSPTLVTPRLTLRPPLAEDAVPIARHLNDFAVAGKLARVPFPYRLADARAWLASRPAALPPEETGFSILAEGFGLVGHVGFQRGVHGPVIGYWLGQPFWGRGLMTEAAVAAIAWFFGASAAPVLYSGVFHFNAASLAVQHKLGFAETGRSRLLCLARGAQVEHIDTELTRESFTRRWPPALPSAAAR